MGSLLMVWVLEAGEEARSPASLPPPSPTFEIALRKLQREEEGWLQKIDKANFWNHTNRLAGSPGGGAGAVHGLPTEGTKKVAVPHSAELECTESG